MPLLLAEFITDIHDIPDILISVNHPHGWTEIYLSKKDEAEDVADEDVCSSSARLLLSIRPDSGRHRKIFLQTDEPFDPKTLTDPIPSAKSQLLTKVAN